MSNKAMEDKFLDFIDGTLSTEESASMKQALESDAALRSSFDAYKRVISLERSLAAAPEPLHANFAVKVMDRIGQEEKGFLKRLGSMWLDWKKVVVPAVATFATLVLVVKFSEFGPAGFYERPLPVDKVSARDIQIAEMTAAKSNEIKEKEDADSRLITAGPSAAGVIAPAPVQPASKDGNRQLAKEGIASRALEQKFESEFQADLLTDSQGKNRESAPAAMPAEPVQLGKKQAEGKLGFGAPPQKKPGIGGVMPSQANIVDLSAGETSAGAAISNDDLSRERMIDGVKDEESNYIEKEKSAPKSHAGQLHDYLLQQRAEARGDNKIEKRAGAPVPPPAERSAEIFGKLLNRVETDQEQYKGYEENLRLNVSDTPSSTFSIDVDTASYTNARRFLKQGILPPKDSIRIEEFINYFDYNYPKQYEKPFDLNYEIAPSPLETDRFLLKLGLKARDVKETAKPWNLIFLVDVSGSMADSNKLPLVKSALKLVVERMKERDKIGIVTYAGDAGVALEPSGKDQKTKILEAIEKLSAGGSTNGSGGIEAAYREAESRKIDGGVNRVILATDGDFNVGITDFNDLLKLIENKRKSGITLTALGFGYGNLKDGTLEQLANKGNGNYFYIDSFQEARKVLDTDLLSTLEVVAKDVKLQVEFNPQKITSYRLVGYENRRLKREDFNNDAIDAGEIGSGHTVTAFYELVLKDSPLAKKLADEYRYQKQIADKTEVSPNEFSGEVGFLKIRFKEPDANESKLLQFPIEEKQIKQDAREASADFRFAAAVSYFAHLLRGSQFAGNYTYKDVVTLAESSRGEDKLGYRQEFIEVAKNALAVAQ